MKTAEELSLKELREMFPGIKATSRKVFLEKIAEIPVKVDNEPVKQVKDVPGIKFEEDKETDKEIKGKVDPTITKMLQDRRSLLKYLLEEGGKRMSVLVVLYDDAEKVDVYKTMQYGLESWKLGEMAEGRKVTPFLFRERMFEIHIGGQTYVKFACSTMKEYYEKKQPFTVVKDLR